jgi:hypothetical protein
MIVLVSAAVGVTGIVAVAGTVMLGCGMTVLAGGVGVLWPLGGAGCGLLGMSSTSASSV